MKEWIGYQKGINLGGWLSQCDHTEDNYNNFIKEEDIKIIADFGADHVRVPIDYNLIQSTEGEYIESGFKYIEKAIEWTGKYKLNMVLDLHKTFGYSFDAGEKEEGFFDSEKYQERFYQLWETLAERFGKYHDRVAFEILNEITDRDYCQPWNRIANTCINRIRAIAPQVTILVGGYWNNHVEAIKDIELDSYENIILNFHCYDPFIYTHQRAYWVEGMPKDLVLTFPTKRQDYIDAVKNFRPDLIPAFEKAMGEDEIVTEAYFERIFKEAIDFAEERNTSLYCGEYGVIDLSDTDSTLNWFRTIHPVFRKCNIGHATWSYKLMDFGLTDQHMKPIIDDVLDEMFGK